MLKTAPQIFIFCKTKITYKYIVLEVCCIRMKSILISLNTRMTYRVEC